MSQPPQDGWGPGQPEPPYGQSSPNSGYGDYPPAQPDGYGHPSPSEGYGGYGQDPSAASPGSGPAFGGAGPSAPEKKSNVKIPIIICAGCAVLALIVAIIGGGIFLFTRDGGETTGAPATTQEDPADEDPAEEDPAEGEPAEDEPAEDEPAEEDQTDEDPAEEDSPDAGGDGEGARDNPYAAGEPFTLDDGEGGEIEVTLDEVDWDATDAIMEANQFNDEPEDDETYIMVPVTVSYSGPDSVSPSFTLSVSYVAGSGNSYRMDSAVTPRPAIDTNDIYDGGSEEFDMPFLVPEDDVEDGAFTVSALLDFEAEEVWVAAE